MKQLIEIQKRLKAPKDKHNKFGGFNYRSAEGILEAVKPICHELGCSLVLSDEIFQVGERYYVMAYARLISPDGETVVTAYAREPESKKGMDESQITGTASSYARKYALNGLFAIDDAKDADTDEYQGMVKAAEEIEALESKPITKTHIQHLESLIEECGADLSMVVEAYRISELKDMTEAQYVDCMTALKKKYQK